MAEPNDTVKTVTATVSSGYFRYFTRFAVGIAFIGLLLGIGVTGLVSTSSGMQWLLAMVGRFSGGMLEFKDVQGNIANLRIDAMHYIDKDLSIRIEKFVFVWHPGDLLSQQLTIDELSIQTIATHLLPPDPESPPPTMPENLVLPFKISIPNVSIASIYVYSYDEPDKEWIISDVVVAFNSDGKQHHLQRFDLITQWGGLTSSVNLEGHAPFVLTGQIELHPAEPAEVIHTKITGNLESLQFQLSTQQHQSSAEIQGEIAPFAVQPIITLDIRTDKLNPAQWLPETPSANLSITVNLHNNAQQQLQGAIAIQNHAPATIDQHGLPVSEIRMQALVSPEILQLHDLSIRIGKQEVVRGNVDWQVTTNTGIAKLSIDKLNPRLIDQRVQAAQISGAIKFEGDTHQQIAHIDLKDNLMVFNAALTRVDELITLQRFYLQHKKSQWRGKGTFRLGQKQSFELSSQLVNFNLVDFIQAPDSNLNATIDVVGKLTPKPSGKLNYAMSNSFLKKAPLSGAGHIAFNGLDQFTSNAELKIATNQLLAQGGLGKPNDTFQLMINAPALEQIGVGISGDVKGSVKLSGKMDAPTLEADIVSKKLKLSEQRQIEDLSLTAQLKNDAVGLKLTAQTLIASGQAKLQQFNVFIEGTKHQHSISASTRINNEFAFNLKGSGGLEQKYSSSPKWQGKIAQLSLTGKIPVELTTPMSLSASAEAINLGATQLSVSNGKIDIEQAQWTPKNWETKGQFSGIAISPGESLDTQQIPLHLGGNWNLTSSAQLKGHLQVQREKGDWFLPGDNPQPLQLEMVQLKVTARPGRISAEFLSASPLIGNAKAQVSIPTHQSDSGWSLASNAPLQGAVDAQITSLGWMNPLLGEGTSLNGNLKIAATIMGTLDNPDFNGTVSGQQLSFSMLEQGIQLQQGSLTASFHETDLNIQRLHFITLHVPAPDERVFRDRKLGNSDIKLKNNAGSLTVNGNVSLIGNKTQLNFVLDEFQIASKTDYWMVTSGSGQVAFQDKRLTIAGNMSTDAGVLIQPPEGHPEVSDDVVIYTSGVEKNTPQSSKLSLLLDVTINLGEKFYISAAGLEGRLAGQLQVRNDENNTLKAKGSIAAQDTTYKAYGQDLTVKRGMVNFNGPIDDPGLNVLAVREGLAVVAGVEISGTVRQPQVKLVSTPDVPDSEKLSWIALGRKPEAGGVDTSVLLTAASAILGGQSGGGITSQLSNAIGLDEISFKQATPGSSLTGQIGVMGKRISSRIYISYERSLLTNTMGITKLTYSLTPKISIVTQAGEDNAADLFYTLQID